MELQSRDITNKVSVFQKRGPSFPAAAPKVIMKTPIHQTTQILEEYTKVGYALVSSFLAFLGAAAFFGFAAAAAFFGAAFLAGALALVTRPVLVLLAAGFSAGALVVDAFLLVLAFGLGAAFLAAAGLGAAFFSAAGFFGLGAAFCREIVR
jgi:hypothetical protein